MAWSSRLCGSQLLKIEFIREFRNGPNNQRIGSVPWLFVIAKMKLKESAGSGLDARTSSDFRESKLWPLSSKLTSKGKIRQGQQKGPLDLWSPRKLVCGKGETKKLYETREYSVKEWLHFLDG